MMMEFWQAYALFFAKGLTAVVLLIVLVAAVVALKGGDDDDEENKLKITSLNDTFINWREQLYAQMLDKKAWKAREKALKKAEKAQDEAEKPRLFVLDFDGDVEASAVADLREHISTILQVAEKTDKVLLRLESGGGFVHSYGLAASELVRLRVKELPLVVAVDKIAASGGYMMACVGTEIIAAPFAVIGSVGVIGAVPNFHELLSRNHIQYEQHTAGEHKRSLTVFGKNTDEDRAQFKKELAETHELFKNHIAAMRPQLNVEAIATGETWYGSQALAKGLIDRVQVSDDYLLEHIDSHQIWQISYEANESFIERIKGHIFGQWGRAQASAPLKSRFR